MGVTVAVDVGVAVGGVLACRTNIQIASLIARQAPEQAQNGNDESLNSTLHQTYNFPGKGFPYD